jgi:hypothetical protein
VLLLLGGLALVAGTFMDWVHADIVGAGIHAGSGWSNVQGQVGDGPVIAILGAALAVAGAVMFAVGLRTRGRVLTLFIALGAAAMVVYEYVDLTRHRVGITTTLQAGVWVMAAGSALGLIGAVVGMAARRTTERAPDAPPPVSATVMPVAPPSAPPPPPSAPPQPPAAGQGWPSS